jgi:hypothetical protein
VVNGKYQPLNVAIFLTREDLFLWRNFQIRDFRVVLPFGDSGQTKTPECGSYFLAIIAYLI